MKNRDTDLSNTPRMVISHDIQTDTDYADWIAELKHRYRSAQVRAAVRVNAEKLLFNWLLGRDLVQKKAEERWGAGVVEQVSLDLQREFPNADGFSTTNLWNMKKWYTFYMTGDSKTLLQSFSGKSQQAANQFPKKLHQVGVELDFEILHQAGGEFPLSFALVPWRHHVEIITKCKTVEEALFYVRETIETGMSRAALQNCIKANLYSTRGKIANNFAEHLPLVQSKLVQEVMKENYDFGFATVSHEIYDEAELEEALTKNVTDLLLELGNGLLFSAGRNRLSWVDAHVKSTCCFTT